MTAQTWYKAVRLDKTSHYDQKTKWVAKRIIKPDSVDECAEPCGHGIHCSPTPTPTPWIIDGNLRITIERMP